MANYNKPWNFGLNKFNNSKLAEAGKKLSTIKKGVKLSEKHKERISETSYFKILNKQRKKERKTIYCKNCNHKIIVSINDNKTSFCSKSCSMSWRNKNIKIVRTKKRKCSDEAKIRMSISARKRFLQNNINYAPNIGRNETKILNEQETKDNCKIKRQYQIPGLYYTVDGYCEETNTVYEIYEKAHNKKVFKDLQRENEICNKLNCDFVIIWDSI